MRLTLETGSGHNPDVRSDILVDKYLRDVREREGDTIFDRSLFIADGESLPFRTKSSDFVLVKHILDHAQDAGKFLKEMERLGKAGYIAPPNPITEKLFHWPFHRWFISLENGQLKLKRKEKADMHFDTFFHLLVNMYLCIRLFLRRHQDLFQIRFTWKGSIPFSVESTERSSRLDFMEEMACLDKEEAQPLIARLQQETEKFKLLSFLVQKTKSCFRQIRSHMAKWHHRGVNFEDIFPGILCCPRCKDAGDLTAGLFSPSSRGYPSLTRLIGTNNDSNHISPRRCIRGEGCSGCDDPLLHRRPSVCVCL